MSLGVLTACAALALAPSPSSSSSQTVKAVSLHPDSFNVLEESVAGNELWCSLWCQMAGIERCPSYQFDAADSRCLFGSIVTDYALTPPGLGLPTRVNIEMGLDLTLRKSHALIMGATDSGCTNLIYNLVPEPVRDPPYPERSLADCSFPMLTEFDNGILACGGGGSRECHHLPWGGQVWQPHSTMINSHTRGQAVVIQGKVWVSGSRLATELYDGSQWVAGPNLPFSCSDHRMIVISSQEVLFLGGHDPASAGRVRIYSFKTSQWRTLPNLSPLRHSVGATLFKKQNGDKVVIAVGGAYNAHYYYQAQLLDLKTETWSSAANYPMQIGRMRMVTVNNEPMLLGGMTTGAVKVADVYAYDDITDTWVAKDPLPLAVHDYDVIVLKS